MYASPHHYVPQCTTDRRPLLVWAVVVTGAGFLLALIFSAPFARSSGYQFMSLALYEAFTYICHQAPERSFFIFGHKLAVCARCTGVYTGFAMCAAAYPLLTSLKHAHAPDRRWLFIATAPLVIDFGLGLLGIWENTHLSRFLTGGLLGAVAVFYIMPGLVELSRLPWAGRGRSVSKPTPFSVTSETPTPIHEFNTK